jgi:cyclophilin family peptidyl-prolyl cis-trans isomerase
MPSEKRQRQDEGRLLRLEEERSATQKHQRRRQLRNIGFLLVAVLIVAVGIAVFGGGDDGESSSDTTDGDESTSTTQPPVELVLPGEGAAISGETPCPAADGSAARTTSFEQAPPMCIDPTKTYTATIATTEGDLVVELDAAGSPETVNNFVVLSRYHFYDNVPFHRIVTGFVNQAGDPIGPTPGMGGPGYTIEDEPPADPATAYVPGTMAMARTQEANSAGSQWFFVIGDEGGALSGTGTYAVLGTIVDGEVVSATINSFGSAAVDGAPTKVVAINGVTIEES